MEETTKRQPAFDTSNISIYRSPAAETKEDEEELMMKVRELERLNALIAEGKAMLAMKTPGTPPDCECPTQADKTPEILIKCPPHGFLPVLQQTPSTMDNHRTTALSEKSCGAEPYDPFEVDAEDENPMMEGSIKGLHHESQQQEVTAEEVGIGTGPYGGIDMVSPIEGQLLSKVKGAGIGGMDIVSHRKDRPFSEPEVEDEETYLYREKPGDCHPTCSKRLKSSDQCEKTERTHSTDKSEVPKLTFGELETIFLSMGFHFPQSSTVNQLGSKVDDAIKPHGTTPSLFSSHVDTHGSQVYNLFQVSEEEHGNEAMEASQREHGNQPVKAGVEEQWKQAMEAIPQQPEMGGHGKQLVEAFIEEHGNPLMETAIGQHGNRPLEEGTLVQPQEGLLGEDGNALSGYDLESSKQEGEDFFSRAKMDKEHNRSNDHETGGQTKCMDNHHQANKAIPKAVSLQHSQGPVTNSVETIWICGDGLVDLASRLANSPTYGMKLGHTIAGVRLYWKGELSMKWAGLVPLLHLLACDWPIPDMLIIHLGDDDIIMRDTEELQCAMERDLTFIHDLFPHCLIVWSDLLPNKISKQGSSALVVQDGIHDVVNRRMHAVVAALGGMALTHELLIPELYRHHGARFSRLVVEKLFLNIKQFVSQWSLEVERASEMCSPECHPPPCASSFTCSILDDSIHPKSTNSHSKHKERPPSHPPSLPKKQEQVGEGQVKPKEVRLSTETAKRSTGVMEAKQCMEQRTRSPELVKPCPVPDESSASTHLKSPNSHPKPKEKYLSTLVLKKQQVTEAKVMDQDTEEVKCTTDNAKQPTEDTMVASQSSEMLNQPMGSNWLKGMVNQPMVAYWFKGMVNQPMVASQSTEMVNQPMVAYWSKGMVNQPMVASQSTEVVNRPMVTSQSTEVVNQPMVTKRSTDVVKQPMVAKRPAEVVNQPMVAGQSTEVVNQPMVASQSTEVLNQPMVPSQSTEVVNQLMVASQSTEVVNQPIRAKRSAEVMCSSEEAKRSRFTSTIPDDLSTATCPKATNGHPNPKGKPSSTSLPTEQQVSEAKVMKQDTEEVKCTTDNAKQPTEDTMVASQSTEMLNQPMGSKRSAEVVNQPMVASQSTEVVNQPMVARQSTDMLNQPMGSKRSAEVVNQPMVASQSTEVVNQPMVASQSTEMLNQPMVASQSTEMVNQPMVANWSKGMVNQPVVTSQSTGMVNQPMGSKRSTDVVNQPMLASWSTEVVNQPIVESRSTEVVNQPIGAKQSAEVMSSSEEAKPSRFTSTIPDDSSAASCPKATNSHPNPKGKPSSTSLPTEQQVTKAKVMDQVTEEVKCTTDNAKQPTEDTMVASQSTEMLNQPMVASQSTEMLNQPMGSKRSTDVVNQPMVAKRSAEVVNRPMVTSQSTEVVNRPMVAGLSTEVVNQPMVASQSTEVLSQPMVASQSTEVVNHPLVASQSTEVVNRPIRAKRSAEVMCSSEEAKRSRFTSTIPDDSSTATCPKATNGHPNPKGKPCSTSLPTEQVTEAKVMDQDTEEVKCTTDNAKQPTEDTMVASQSTEMLKQPMGSKRSTDVVNQPMLASRSTEVVNQPIVENRSTEVVNQPIGAKRSVEVMCSSEGAKPSRFTSTIPDDSSAGISPKATNSHPNPKGKPCSTSLPTEQQQVGEEKYREAKRSTEERKLPTEEAKRSMEMEKQFTEVSRQSTEEPKQSPDDARWSREEARGAASAGARAVLAEKREALEAQKTALEAKLAKFAVSPTLRHTTEQQLKDLKIKLKIRKTIAKRVWIIGDSGVLISIQKHMFMRPVENGLVWKPYWIPLKGVTLSKVIQHLLDVCFSWPNPDMLIIHLGSSCDIPHGNLEEMVLTIQEHLLMIRRIFPQCALVWSDILSRTHRKTQGHEDAHSTDLASNRHEVNLRMRDIVKQLGGAAIAHGNIQPEHFVSESRMLSDEGVQLFKQNILALVDPWKWDHNYTQSLSEHLPEPTRPANHKETLGPSTDRTDHPITGCGIQKAARVVWICGNNFCGFARDSAKQQSIPLRSGTGSLEVVWKVVSKGRFPLKNLVRSEDKVIRQPDMVIIYLDGGDVRGNWESVVPNLKREMELLHTVFPECLLVWSDIFKGINLSTTDPGLDIINAIMHTAVTELGGRVVTHNNIGPDIFQGNNSKQVISRVTQRANLNIQEFVLKWETEISGLAQNTKPSPQ
ncbi:uncharacterized protein LOC134441450 isoform X2 [Engraulis encrasicolus]|uniref:uncharacterized protein LOC134441450 isoform X2 n=1 Tax=Engraulis encrasicolus TaxID=184585 RepID=UPI002FCF7490